jgi:hypothetical protein
MKIEDYETMLLAVSQALELCEESDTFSDQSQRELCHELRLVQQRLMELVTALVAESPETESP